MITSYFIGFLFPGQIRLCAMSGRKQFMKHRIFEKLPACPWRHALSFRGGHNSLAPSGGGRWHGALRNVQSPRPWKTVVWLCRRKKTSRLGNSQPNSLVNECEGVISWRAGLMARSVMTPRYILSYGRWDGSSSPTIGGSRFGTLSCWCSWSTSHL